MTPNENPNKFIQIHKELVPDRLTSSVIKRGLVLVEMLDFSHDQLGLSSLQVTGSHGDGIPSIAFSQDGKWFATASWDHQIFIWSSEERKIVSILEGHRGKVRRVSFVQNESILITVGDDRQLYFWDLKTCKIIKVLDGISIVAISNSGMKAIMTNEWGGVLQVIDFKTMERSRAFPPQIYQIQAGSISTNDQFSLVGGRNGSLFLLDLKALTYEKLPGHSDWIWSVSFNPLGTWVLSAGVDGVIQLVELEKKNQPIYLSGHTMSVFCAQYTPDGKYIISTSADKTIRLWNPQSMLPIQSYNLESEAISIAVSEEGKQVACGCRNGKIYLWEIRD
jgi:hypothetical protein